MRGFVSGALTFAGLLVVSVTAALLGGVGSATAGTSVVATPSNLHGWAFDETRATGHYEFVDGGLRLWTEGATSTDKVAGYVAVGDGVTLAGVAAGPAPSLDYGVTFGPQPGLQLVVVTDGVARILVGESVYGDRWWMTNNACGTWCDTLGITWSPGGGSAHSATLAEWSAALPGQTVFAFGFSLGSGAHGDGVLRSLSLAGVCYSFDDGPPWTPPTSFTMLTGTGAPPVTSSSSATSTTTATSPPSSATTSPPSTSRSTTSSFGVVGTGVDELADTGSGGVARTAALVASVALVAGLLCLLLAARRRRGDGRDAS